MPTSYPLGKHFEAFVQAKFTSGRYNNASQVLRNALRLMEDRERQLKALDTAIERGLADINDGSVTDADTVFDQIEVKYPRLAEEHIKP